MNSERIFLGWDAPALPRAAAALREEFGADFDGVWIALPGGRAARRLEELLLARSAAAWTPPRIGTIGPITDALVRFPRPRAGSLARELAWAKALQAVDPPALESLTRRRPAADDFAGWIALAGQARALHQELAAERLRFTDAARASVLPDRERERWRTLARAQEAYAELIERCGWCDPHLERLRALEANAPLRRPRALVLIGLAAANGLQRGLLQSAAAQGVAVRALLVAPQSEAAGFDEFGFARTEHWKDRAAPLEDAHWRVADRPADQADEVVAFLAAACGGAPDGRASVAVLQEEVRPFLARRLAERGSGLRPPVGRAVSETAPGRLLDALRAYLQGRAPRAFAALARHPDFVASLDFPHDPGADCDARLSERLPARVDPAWPLAAEVERRCGPLAGAAALPLDEWPHAIGRLLQQVYAERMTREDEDAMEKISGALEEAAALPPSLAAERVDGAEFLRLVMHSCGREELPPDPALRGIEQLGWLELTLDEAPALAVAGFQLGAVPESVHGHPFLPESLREALGMPTNADRRARDVWALHVLRHAREAFLCVSGQRSTAGDPWLPSPLVFRGADDAARVREFYRAPAPQAAATPGATTPWAPPVPPPARAADPNPLPDERPYSASALNLYLKSPRLYWLQRVLRLETIEPEPHELDALQFGTFTHAALAEFHADPACAELRDADAIAGAACKRMRDLAERRFGARPLAAVRLQLAQLESRLRAWARVEARSRAEGWRTIHVEWPAPAAGVPVEVALEDATVRFMLGGRLDRVDRRATAEGGVEIRVLDYKTGEKPSTDGKAFKPKAKPPRWEDLQLPLYRHLASVIEPGAQIRLGWFNLPRAAEETGIETAGWSEAALELADATAAHAVLGIRAGDFAAIGAPMLRTLSPSLLVLLGASVGAPDEPDEDPEEEA